MRYRSTWLLIAAIAVVALTRLVPHPPNFSPLVAVALFSGAVFADRWLALAVTLGSMLVADLILGFHDTLQWVYLAMALLVFGGGFLRGSRRILRLAGAGVAGSAVFFLVSNVGVWIQGDLYPQTAEGLVACFVAAVPFFPQTLGSTLLYGGVLLALERLWVARAPAPAL